MEVRIIKTCQGFQKVLFLDGALVPAHTDLRSTPYIELAVEEIEMAAFQQNFNRLTRHLVILPRPPEKVIETFNRHLTETLKSLPVIRKQ